jgi:fumarate hydratase subunit alpha
MRTIRVEEIIEAVREACIRINLRLAPDVLKALERALALEGSPGGRLVLEQLLENARLAEASGVPLCQDTGLAVVFADLGRELRLDGSLTLEEAVGEGVRRGYAEGFLRKSVCDPFSRVNTGDNTPAIVHTRLVPGAELRLSVLAKGGGSENMSRVTMLAPAEGWAGIRKYVLRLVAEAGPDPCPPVIVGLGIGGSFDAAAILAKRALLRPLDAENPDAELAAKERELLADINSLGIGPMGLGGDTTCLGVCIKAAPCHIASLPLAVNMQCHSARHTELTL